MSTDITAWDLIRAAEECVTCGKEHKKMPLCKDHPEHGATWADPVDGHPYRPRIQSDAVSKLRILAAGLVTQKARSDDEKVAS